MCNLILLEYCRANTLFHWSSIYQDAFFTLVCQCAERNSRHVEFLVDSAGAAGENAAVSKACHGAIPRQLG